MSAAKKATVYFESGIHKALRLKAAETDQSVSDIVNEAIEAYLAEDADDLAAIKKRKGESTVSYEDVLKDLRKNGLL